MLNPTPVIKSQVVQRINLTPAAKVWTPVDFLDLGSRDAVDKTLQRMVASNDMRRIDRGLYDQPRLTLVDETGQSSSGQLADVDEIAAPGWSYGERGYVGINVDGTFYRYKDAVQRFKVPEGTAWNFIRWDSGQLCVRA